MVAIVRKASAATPAPTEAQCLREMKRLERERIKLRARLVTLNAKHAVWAEKRRAAAKRSSEPCHGHYCET